MPSSSDVRTQRANALERANQVRRGRVVLREALKSGDLSIRDLLLEPPGPLGGMKLIDVLQWTPWVGRRRAVVLMGGSASRYLQVAVRDAPLDFRQEVLGRLELTRMGPRG